MTHCYKLSALIYYLIVSVEVPSQLGGFSAWSHGAEGKVSGLLRVSSASSKPTGCWRNSFSLVVGLRSLLSCQFKIFFGCGPFLKSLLEKKKKVFIDCYNIASILRVFAHKACWIWVPSPETELTHPLHWKLRVLTTRPPMKSPSTHGVWHGCLLSVKPAGASSPLSLW